MSAKLKLCPFCGSVPEIRFEEYCGDFLNKKPWKMYCCIIETYCFESVGELVNAWNGRVGNERQT